MKNKEGFIANQEIKINYFETNQDKNLTIIIIPGMINSAEQVFEELGRNLNYHCIYLSLRGRGKSDSPENGYSFEKQVSDIAALVNELNLKNIYIYGHSVGGSFALGYCLSNQSNIKGLIIGDYPPIYSPLDEEWKKQIVHNNSNTLSETAINGLIKDSTFVNMIPKLAEINFPTLILRGELEGSILSELDVNEFKSLSDKIFVDVINGSDHNLHMPTANNLISKLEDFINN